MADDSSKSRSVLSIHLREQSIGMLSKVISISRFPFHMESRLLRAGNFYIRSDFNNELIRPPITLIEDTMFYQFMNFIYSPQPPEKLTPEQVIEVCDLRLDFLNELVNVKFNNCIMKAIADCITSTFTNMSLVVKALDFGCGFGLSSRLLLNYPPNLDIMGIDVSEKAIGYCHEQGLPARHIFPDEQLPFETATFDLIFAAFVMQFSMDLSTLAELSRLLRPSRKFVFNAYQRKIDGVIQRLRKVGFDSFEIWDNIPGIDKNYTIVSCTTLSSCETALNTIRLGATGSELWESE